MEVLIPIFVFATLVVGLIVLGAYLSRKRRSELTVLASRLGLEFEPEKDPFLADGFSFLSKLAHGRDRYAYNVLRGAYAGEQVLLFDYHYKTGSGKNTHHHHLGCLILQLRGDFPELLVAPENFFSKIAQAFGYDDIDFESAEFSRAFCVRSPDRRFAYAVCHPAMMEYLLANRDLSFEIERSFLALIFPRTLSPEQMEFNLERLVRLRALLPEGLSHRA